MKTCLIINPNAGSAEKQSLLQRSVERRGDVVCWRTAEAGEGIELAQRAREEGYERVAAVGGDGTINEVVNGLMRDVGPEGVETVLGIIPMGTGNDLANTLALPEDPHEAFALLQNGQDVRLDLMEVQAEEQTVFGVNAAAGGFSGQVDEQLTTEMKKAWGPLAFLLGAARALPTLREYDTRIAFDDGSEQVLDVLNVIIANGRTAAGGNRVAPVANPCDGLLDVVVVKWGTAAELAEVGTRLIAGNYLESPHVVHHRVRRVRVLSMPGMWFNVDGELFTKEPVTFAVRPSALRVIVGPGFQPEPDV